MVGRLKSIIERIPWSSLLKALVVAVAWSVLPFWLFALVALGFYLIPLFRPLSMGLVFLVLLWFAAVLPPSWLAALAIGTVFYFILGIKDLVFIHRDSAFEFLLYIYALLYAFEFFGGAALFGAGTVAGLLAFVVLGFLLVRQGVRSGTATSSTEAGVRSDAELRLFPAVIVLILAELLVALLFVPLNQYFQTLFFFLGAAVLIGLARDYSHGALTPRRVLIHFSIFLTFMVVMLALTQWSL